MNRSDQSLNHDKNQKKKKSSPVSSQKPSNFFHTFVIIKDEKLLNRADPLQLLYCFLFYFVPMYLGLHVARSLLSNTEILQVAKFSRTVRDRNTVSWNGNKRLIL